jgi:hypothetical protein
LPATASTARNTPYRGISAVLLRQFKIFSAVVKGCEVSQILRKCFESENGGGGCLGGRLACGILGQ